MSNHAEEAFPSHPSVLYVPGLESGPQGAIPFPFLSSFSLVLLPHSLLSITSPLVLSLPASCHAGCIRAQYPIQGRLQNILRSLSRTKGCVSLFSLQLTSPSAAILPENNKVMSITEPFPCIFAFFGGVIAV